MAEDQYFWIFLLVVFGSRKSVPKFELWLKWWVLGPDQGTTFFPEFLWWMAQSFGHMEKKPWWRHSEIIRGFPLLPWVMVDDGSSCPVNDYQLRGVFMVLLSNQNWLKVKHDRKHLHFIRKKLQLPGKSLVESIHWGKKRTVTPKKKRTRDRQRNMWLKGPKQCWRWILLRPSPIL